MISNHDEPETFGAILQMFRKRQRLTQQRLAVAVGVHRHAIIRWEQGDVLPASKAVVLEIASRLSLSEQEARFLLDASMTAPAPIWGLPFPRNPFFTGREQELETLHQHLYTEQNRALTQTYALHGLGGVGKTQTVIEYAYRHALTYSALFWIEAETLERVQASIQHIAELLHLPEQAASEQPQVVEAVQRWLTTHDQWLLIWDNLEDLDLPYRLLPPTRQGAFLFTTRRQALGALTRGFDLPPMEPDEGTLLLLRRAKLLEPDVPASQISPQPAASELVTLLGGLPLALDQAGAYLEETGCALEDYLRAYKQQRAFLLARRGGPGALHPQSVAMTFALALERIEQEKPAAADLLRLCAFLHAEAIPMELFHHVTPTASGPLTTLTNNPAQFDLALATLRSFSLIQRQAETQTISLHRLIQAVLREQLDPQEEQAWGRAVVCLVNAAFPTVDLSTWGQCERLLAQALACQALLPIVGDTLPEAGALLHRAGFYLLKRGRFEEARPVLEQAVLLGEQLQEPDYQILIARLIDLAELFWQQGRFTAAEEQLTRVLTIVDQHQESEHTLVADTLNNLALLYWEQGKYAQAEPLFLRSVALHEQYDGPTHLDLADPLNNLGLLYWKQMKFAQAEPFYQRALAIHEQIEGPDHPGVANVLNNLAALYRDRGEYARAETLFQRAFSIREQALGPEHPETAMALFSLAVISFELGNEERAEELLQRTRTLRERLLGPDHPNMAYVLLYLGRLSQKQGHLTQAEQLLQQTLALREQTLGPDHPEIGTTLNYLAALQSLQGQDVQAEALFQRALMIQERQLGPDHPHVAFSLQGLATLHARKGKFAEAQILAERALQIYEQRLGYTHPETARCLVALAEIEEHTGKETRAGLLLQRAYTIFACCLGPEHAETLQVKQKQAVILLKRGGRSRCSL